MRNGAHKGLGRREGLVVIGTETFSKKIQLLERERKERRERIRERTPVCAWETSDRRDESGKTRPLR